MSAGVCSLIDENSSRKKPTANDAFFFLKNEQRTNRRKDSE